MDQSLIRNLASTFDCRRFETVKWPSSRTEYCGRLLEARTEGLAAWVSEISFIKQLLEAEWIAGQRLNKKTVQEQIET